MALSQLDVGINSLFDLSIKLDLEALCAVDLRPKSVPNTPLEELYKQGNPSFGYTGTLRDVVQELEQAYADPTSKNILQRALHPSRIIRAVLDYKIGKPFLTQPEDLMIKACNTALALYQKQADAQKELTAFETWVSNYPGLLDQPISQEIDIITQEASEPNRNKTTASRLNFDPTPVLFIALGHGGLAAGLDVFTRYCELRTKNDDEQGEPQFYAIRFSRIKKGDSSPQLDESEKKYLRELAKGRQVVLFDEDSSTGETLIAARSYLECQITYGKPIRTYTNLDARQKIGLTPKVKKYYHEYYHDNDWESVTLKTKHNPKNIAFLLDPASNKLKYNSMPDEFKDNPVPDLPAAGSMTLVPKICQNDILLKNRGYFNNYHLNNNNNNNIESILQTF